MISSLCVTKCVACLGIVISSLALAPVIYTHIMDREHSTLLPWLSSLQVTIFVLFVVLTKIQRRKRNSV